MAIAKGQTNCRAERDTTLFGFNDLLKIANDSKLGNEAHIKANLYDIITNNDDSPEEKNTQKRPLEEALNSQEESDIRIRRAILMGLFSFWEISLKELCQYYDIALNKKGKKNNSNQQTGNSRNKKSRFYSSDYLWSIFYDNIPEDANLIDTNIGELRNYMTHGDADNDRQQAIKNLAETHPEFDIKEGYEAHLASYQGLLKIKELIESTLNQIETYIKENQNPKRNADDETQE